jgi:hypothetical protein
MNGQLILLFGAGAAFCFVFAKASVMAWKRSGYAGRWKGWHSKLEQGCLILLAVFAGILSFVAAWAALAAGGVWLVELLKN